MGGQGSGGGEKWGLCVGLGLSSMVGVDLVGSRMGACRLPLGIADGSPAVAELRLVVWLVELCGAHTGW